MFLGVLREVDDHSATGQLLLRLHIGSASEYFSVRFNSPSWLYCEQIRPALTSTTSGGCQNLGQIRSIGDQGAIGSISCGKASGLIIIEEQLDRSPVLLVQ